MCVLLTFFYEIRVGPYSLGNSNTRKKNTISSVFQYGYFFCCYCCCSMNNAKAPPYQYSSWSMSFDIKYTLVFFESPFLRNAFSPTVSQSFSTFDFFFLSNLIYRPLFLHSINSLEFSSTRSSCTQRTRTLIDKLILGITNQYYTLMPCKSKELTHLWLFNKAFAADIRFIRQILAPNAFIRNTRRRINMFWLKSSDFWAAPAERENGVWVCVIQIKFRIKLYLVCICAVGVCACLRATFNVYWLWSLLCAIRNKFSTKSKRARYNLEACGSYDLNDCKAYQLDVCIKEREKVRGACRSF